MRFGELMCKHFERQACKTLFEGTCLCNFSEKRQKPKLSSYPRVALPCTICHICLPTYWCSVGKRKFFMRTGNKL